jgi:hypothetical protein
MKMLRHKFVEFIPDSIENGTLYISIDYCTAIHKCVCGCGNEVVTPLSPTDWKMIFNGKSVSLYPSIGNWNFKCQSHYWIKENRIEHAGSWSNKNIQNGRARDAETKQEYYENREPEVVVKEESIKVSLWRRLINFLSKFY